MLNLTDMWRAAGRAEHRRPADWLALEETMRFRAHADTHLTALDEPVLPNAGDAGIWAIDTDGLVAAIRGHGGGTWAHWQLALSYACYLSPAFHLWCNTVVRAAMKRPDVPAVQDSDPLPLYLAEHFRHLHRRLDTVDRHAADLMFLALSGQELVLGGRREFSELSRTILIRVAMAEPYDGRCPCCGNARILSTEGRPLAGTEFDHFFHRRLNRPEHGWLVCTVCHGELTHGGYLVRFARTPEFRAFQARVLKQRRLARERSGASPR
ncbi:KilA-N domain-containing protein [Belnapia sp. T18]|uniref:KilA-N domain-containing protein n=2 Tax=Belnapia arida TaxID=2804533 RepID=A0ABS1UEI1_9PROT|nr:KilA-N domain-containing protein [Belnapia arida]